MDYQKEADEHQKYMMNWEQVKAKMDLDLEKFEYLKDQDAIKNEHNHTRNFLDAIKILKQNGTPFSKGVNYSGSSKNGNAPRADNEHYAQRIKTDYSEVSDEALAKIMAVTNLQPDAMFHIWNNLNAYRDSRGSKSLSADEIGAFFSNIVMTELDTSVNLKDLDLDVEDVNQNILDLFKNTNLGGVTNIITTPSFSEELPTDINAEEKIEKAIVNVHTLRLESDIQTLENVETTLVNKGENLSDIQKAVYKWVRARGISLENISKLLESNRPAGVNQLAKLYGPKQEYLRSRTAFMKTYNLNLPEEPMNPFLMINREPIELPIDFRTKEGISFILELLDNKLIMPGHPVYWEDMTGKRVYGKIDTY
jgi:DNA-binding transcriptional MerR regulator